MFTWAIPAALAAAAAQGAQPPAAAVAAAPAAAGALTYPLATDSAMLTAALEGAPLELSLRGTSIAAPADIAPADNGCVSQIAVAAPGVANRWRRDLRWSEVAWTGLMADGRVVIAFFEQEGRLPGDRLAFRPPDPAAFRAALDRVITACRSARGEAERVLLSEHHASRNCYFARVPALELIDSPGGAAQAEPPRAVLSVLARETPEAELHLLFDRAAPIERDDWGAPEVTFTYAGPMLKTARITAARFTFDGEPVTAHHSIAAYGDTRLRIRMDPFRRGAGLHTSGGPGYYAQLATSGVATLTLLDETGLTRAELTFDAGPALAAARQALRGADWSCAASAPTPAPAAEWTLAK